MNNNLVELICVCDRSGSMSEILKDAIGGFDSFINEQKKLDKQINITLVNFDSKYELKASCVDIKKFKSLKEYDYTPRGLTALYDAIGTTINNVGDRLANTNEYERPSKIIFVIQTDGYENCSTEFSLEQIQKMIKHQTNKYNWEFIFLGAGLKEEIQNISMNLGMNKKNAFAYEFTGDGINRGYTEVSCCVAQSITGDDE